MRSILVWQRKPRKDGGLAGQMPVKPLGDSHGDSCRFLESITYQELEARFGDGAFGTAMEGTAPGRSTRNDLRVLRKGLRDPCFASGPTSIS